MFPMKKYLFILFVPFLFLASCKTNEDKALKLIDQHMFSTLYDYESYQPVETKIDSAFTQPIFTDSILYLASKYLNAIDKKEELKRKRESAESTMDIWANPYSAYSKKKYNDARKEYIDLSLAYGKSLKEETQLWIQLIDCVRNFESEYCGWGVYHKYRCKSRGGNPLLCEAYFFIAPDFSAITNYYDLDDEEYQELADCVMDVAVISDEDFENIKALIPKADQVIEKFSKMK